MNPKPLGPSSDAWGKNLIDPVLIEFRGIVISFAREKGKDVNALYYNVLDLQKGVERDDEAWTGWYALPFTGTSLESIGIPNPKKYEVKSRTEPPQLRVAGMELITVPPTGQAVKAADARFQIVSDNDFIYIFRESKSGSLYINRMRLLELPAKVVESNRREDNVTPSEFLIAQAWEVRYQRSELKRYSDRRY